MPSLRLFIAIETPTDIRPQLGAIRDHLKSSNAGVKWESDEKLHVTLKFLGNTDDQLLPQIVYTIEGVGQRSAPLEVRYKGVGCFPNPTSPRVIWIGVEDQKDNLNPVQREIESSLIHLGFEREEKEFHPHVTLGRVKGTSGINSLLRTMESITFESQPVTIREIALIKSELHPEGSIYTTLKRIPLGK